MFIDTPFGKGAHPVGVQCFDISGEPSLTGCTLHPWRGATESLYKHCTPDGVRRVRIASL